MSKHPLKQVIVKNMNNVCIMPNNTVHQNSAFVAIDVNICGDGTPLFFCILSWLQMTRIKLALISYCNPCLLEILRISHK